MVTPPKKCLIYVHDDFKLQTYPLVLEPLNSRNLTPYTKNASNVAIDEEIPEQLNERNVIPRPFQRDKCVNDIHVEKNTSSHLLDRLVSLNLRPYIWKLRQTPTEFHVFLFDEKHMKPDRTPAFPLEK